MDIFARTSPGDPINGDPAEFYNLTIDAVQDYLRRRKHMSPPQELKLPSLVDVMVRNTADDPLPQFAVVRLGTAVNVPRGEDVSFYGHAVFDAADPAEGKPFGVLQMPITQDAIARVTLHGMALVLVNFTDLDHEFADQIVGDTAKLLSQAEAGPARVYWKDTPDSTTLDGGIDAGDTELDIDTSSPGHWPDPAGTGSYAITIDTEELLVTARDEATLTVTRGHNSTTPASHSGGASIAFTSGVLWALVLIDPNNADSGGDCDGCDCCPCECEAFEMTGPDMDDPTTEVIETWTSPNCASVVQIEVIGAGGQGWTLDEDLNADPDGASGGGGGAYARGEVRLAPETELTLSFQATAAPGGVLGGVSVSGMDSEGNPFEITAGSGESGAGGVALGGQPSSSNVSNYVGHAGGDGLTTFDLGDLNAFGGTPGTAIADGTSTYEQGADGTDPGTGGGGSIAMGFPTKGGYGRVRIKCLSGVLGINGETGSIQLVGKGAQVSSNSAGVIEILADAYEAENKHGSSISAGIAVTIHSSGIGVVKAQANSDATYAAGLMSETTADGFSGVVRTGGALTLSDWTAVTGTASLNPRAVYFLSPTTAGLLTTTRPTTIGHIVQEVGIAVSASTLQLTLQPPILL